MVIMGSSNSSSGIWRGRRGSMGRVSPRTSMRYPPAQCRYRLCRKSQHIRKNIQAQRQH